MTDKEIARFKVKFPKINLSKQRLDAMKLNLADDADEASIDAKLDEVNTYFPYEEIAKEDDRLRQPPKPTPPPAPVPGNPPAPAPPAPGDDTPPWAKTLIENQNKITERLNTIETGKTTDSRKTQLETALKAANASDAFIKLTLKNFDLMNFDSDDKFTGYLEGVKTDAADFVQTEANAGLGKMGAPVKTGGSTSKVATKEEAKSLVDSIM